MTIDSAIDAEKEQEQIQEQEYIQEFVVRPAGTRPFVMPDGKNATLFFFTLHDTTPQRNMLVHMVDGQPIPITIQAYPIVEDNPVKKKPSILVPGDPSIKLLH